MDGCLSWNTPRRPLLGYYTHDTRMRGGKGEPMAILDRMRGAFLGLAVGDSLGAAVEFSPPGMFAPVTGYRGGGPHGLGPGEWTDDTSMALALADSIAHAGWDVNDQARRYALWWREGKYSVTGRCFDIGNTTRRALAEFERSADAHTCADRSEDASGNGSIMRLAPVPIHYAQLYPNHIDELVRYAVQSSVPTHASPQCTSACAYMCLVMVAFLHGHPRAEVLSPGWAMLQRLREVHELHPRVTEIAAGSFREKHPPAIKGSGYVIESLEAALWALYDARDFHEAVLRALNLGDDADTTGAVCGQLAGALWGEIGISKEWRDGLAGRQMLEHILKQLVGE